MTKEQAQFAVSELAKRARGSKPLRLFLNSGEIIRGRATYDEATGLLVINGGQGYAQPEQVAYVKADAWNEVLSG